MQFGFYLPCYWPDTSYPAQHMYREAVEQGRLAEELGFVSLSIPEHHFINYLVHPQPLLTAVKVSDATRHIPIITAVLVLPFYDVRRLAGEIAQADCLTGGRLQLGLGRGAFPYEFSRMGVPVGESRERFIDALELLKKLLSEEEVSWNSKWYKFPPLTITPRPMQRPHPPIWIAAVASASIEDAAARGYHVQTTPLRDPFEAARGQAEAFHRGVKRAAANGKQLKLSMLRMGYVSRNEADIKEKIEIALANHKRFVNMYNTEGEVRRGQIVPLEVNLSPEEVENALIIGTPERCIEKLNRYAPLGIDDIQMNMSFGAEHRDIMASMELFATRVMPHFA